MTAISGVPGSVWALTRSGFSGIFRNVFFWIAMGYAALVVGIHVTIIFVTGLFSMGDEAAQQEFIRWILTANFLQNAIRWQVVAVVVVVAIVGTRTVARDRLLGGLEFILSKAVPPWGYVASRSLTPTIASVLLLFIPIVLMVSLMVMIVDTMPSDRIPLLWGAVGAALVISLVLGVLASAVGALVASPRKAIVIWMLLIIGPIPLSGFAWIVGADWYWLVGPLPILYATTFTMMDTPFPGADVMQGWAILAALVVVCLGLMRWRVREVVR